MTRKFKRFEIFEGLLGMLFLSNSIPTKKVPKRIKAHLGLSKGLEFFDSSSLCGLNFKNLLFAIFDFAFLTLNLEAEKY